MTTTGSITMTAAMPRRVRPSGVHAIAVRVGLALARWGRGAAADRDRARLEYERLDGIERRQRDGQAYGLLHR